MINVEQQKSQNLIPLSSQEASNKVREIGQLRLAKMPKSCLVEYLDNKNALTPALRKLLEVSLTLRTTNTKVLADYLQRSPTTIRIELKQIISILGNYSRSSSLHTTKDDEDSLHSQTSSQ